MRGGLQIAENRSFATFPPLLSLPWAIFHLLSPVSVDGFLPQPFLNAE